MLLSKANINYQVWSLALVVFLIVILLFPGQNAKGIVSSGFQRYFRTKVLWLNSTHFVLNNREVYEYDTLKMIFKFSLVVDDIIVCDDHLILQSNSQMINRHSKVADYYKYDSDDKVLIGQGIQEMGCYFYVKDNSLYTRIDNRPIKEGGQDIRVGITDWVYEEELFMVSQAFKEIDKNTVLYNIFDDTAVNNMPILVEGENYPHLVNWKYPRPGTNNPHNSLYFYIKDYKHLLFESSTDMISDYIMHKSYIIFKVLNRIQNKLSYYSTDSYSLNETKKQHLRSFQHTWFEAQHSLQSSSSYFTDIINHILIIVEYPFNIIYSTADLNNPEGADFDVNKIVCINKKRVAYLGTKDRLLGSMQQHLYVYDLLHSANTRITDHFLNHFNMEDIDIGYFDASAHSDCNSVIINYLGPNCNFDVIYNLETEEFKIIQNINKDNIRCPYTTLLDGGITSSFYGNTSVRITRQQLFLSNSTINTMIIYPPTFRVGQKYAVVFNPYQGPDSQSADYKTDQLDRFKLMLLSNDIVIVIADGSGTCCLGPHHKYKIYREIGVLEATDQLNLAKYIRMKAWANEQQIMYFGWSYGGFIALKIAEMDENGIFAAITSVAPVTDWLLYDSIYTERYMGMPLDNANGYSMSKINPNKGFKNPLMICHGTADDNVHFQQTLHMLTDLFSNKNMDITIMPYPDVRHSMGEYRTHLYIQVMMFYGEKVLFASEEYGVREERIRRMVDALSNHS
eukprot:NODE_728_length_4760_cov_0.305299.p1 type:complete len:737 gc:universal NODE_728_length_4760_cov_0.305299:4487-2277(-)